MVAFDPQGSTAALNAAGYLDSPAGRSAYTQDTGATSYPSPNNLVSVNGRLVDPNRQTTSAPAPDPNAAAAAMDAQLSTLIQALSTTNEQDFQEKIREFNQQHALALQQFGLAQQAQAFQQSALAAGLLGTFQGQQTLGAQRQGADIAAQQAGLTGFYNPPGGTGTGATVPPVNPSEFTKQDQATQAIYLRYNGNDPQAAAAKWAQDATKAVQQAVANAGGGGGAQGQPTLQNLAQQAQFGGTYQGQPTLAAQAQQAQLSGMYQGQPTLEKLAQQAQFSGMYQGQPTLAAQAQQAQLSGMYQGRPTEQAREFNTTTGVDLAKTASSLSGPADYFKYLTSLNAGRNIMGTLQGGQPTPGFGAPASGVQPQSIQNILGNLGLGGTGASTSAPNAQSMTARGGGVTIPGFEQFGSLPYPHQIQPTAWTNLGPTGQSFMKGAYAAAGYDPNDIERQIQGAASSTGQAPQTSATSSSFASPAGQSLFG